MKVNHSEMVTKLAKPGEAILATMTPHKMNLLHMSSKLCSEAGEAMDAVGKLCFYDKPLDVANVIEELGDMEFYMEGIRQALGIDRQTTLDANVAKLSARYEGLKYSNEAAIARKDKA